MSRANAFKPRVQKAVLGVSSYDYASGVIADGLGNVFIGGTTGGALPGRY